MSIQINRYKRINNYIYCHFLFAVSSLFSLAGNSERRKKQVKIEEAMGRQYQGKQVWGLEIH